MNNVIIPNNTSAVNTIRLEDDSIPGNTGDTNATLYQIYMKKYKSRETPRRPSPAYKIKFFESSIKLNPAKLKSKPPMPITETKKNFLILPIFKSLS